MRNIFAFMCLCLALISCKEVAVKDGRIPTQYISQARALEGTYDGKFEGHKGSLTLEIRGDTPVLSYADDRGHDLLGPFCESEIGKLTKVAFTGNKNNPVLDKAYFAFNPYRCAMVQGKELAVQIVKNGKAIPLNLTLLDRTQQREICEYPPPRPGGAPERRCHYEILTTYKRGVFKKN
jgi:hypothetical protein